MKTRSEMIYDFMLALASNPNIQACDDEMPSEVVAEWVYEIAAQMADEYLKNI